MEISYRWLQEHINEKLPTPDVLVQKIIFHAFEVEAVQEKDGDTIMDIKVLPDRAGDCLSHAGIAREVAGLLGYTLKEKITEPLPTIAPFPVELQSDLCTQYIAVRIDGVKVGPSPEWLKTKLESLGQRSINNIVDATNFVLLDSGQPVHAFDAEKVDGGIVVRLANEGETIRLLGAKEEEGEKVLKASDLVIADFLGALAIAGVKGGTNAEVTEATTSIIIEVAHFDAVAVRKTSRRLNLITDASKRFENNFSPRFALPAAQQVVAQVLTLAGGTVSAVTVTGEKLPEDRTFAFTTAEIARLLGAGTTTASIAEALGRFHYAFSVDGDTFTFTVPHWRNDITGAHDIAEEVGRVVGYDTIPALPLPFVPTTQPNETDMQMSAVRAWAVQNGFREVYTYTFRPKGEVLVSYGAKGKDALRTNLSDGLKESFELNRLNAPLLGVKEVKLFEIGTVFLKDKEDIHVATCDKGTIQELPLADFIKEKQIDLTALQLPTFNLLPSTFKQWSNFPFVTRDIAVWLSTPEARGTFFSLADEFAKKHCVHAPFLFDEFTKDGRTSVGLRFIFQAPDRTLTDVEVAAVFSVFSEDVSHIIDAEIR